MTTLTIPDIRDEAIRWLEEQARLHRRTLEEEARMRLEDYSPQPPEEVERILEEVRMVRESFTESDITEEFIEKAKNWGRP